MKGLGSDAVDARVAEELMRVGRVWIAPELASLRRLVPRDRLVSDAPDVAIVRVETVGAGGEIVAPACPPSHHVWARLCAPHRFATRLPGFTAKAERVFCELALLEVLPPGLVITELAQGVSAADLQTLAEPTLKISSRIDVMRDSVRDRKPHDVA